MDSIFKAAETSRGEPQGNKKNRTSNSLPKDLSKSLSPLPPTPANKLCEDELSLIFRNSWISTKDLLNFRAVSKSWRDAATRALLLRDACYVRVVLDKNKIQSRVEKNADFMYYRDKLNLGSDEDKQMMLTEFVKLAIVMKNSSKFPASKLCIDSTSTSITIFTVHLDLSLFFVHHRDKIKTVCPRGWTTKNNLHDILFHLTPQLECLDLSEATLTPSDADADADDDGSSIWNSKVLPFKSLILGNKINTEFSHDYNIMSLLLSTPSNLNCIKDVNLLNLPIILENDMGHLIRSFTLNHSEAFDIDNENGTAHSVTLMKQFSETNPQLFELNLVIGYCPQFYFATVPFLNEMIKSSKGTLKALSILVRNTPFDFTRQIHIPPMPNLESITLNINFRDPFDEIVEQLNEENEFFSFQDQVFGNKYFPSLVKVILKRQGLSDLSIEENLCCFFNEILDIKNVSQSVFMSRVESLVLHNCNLPHICYVNSLSDVFSNIRDLHIMFNFLSLVQTCDRSLSFWLQCPSVEFIEIYDILIHENYKRHDVTGLLDVFFTGFSLAMCQKLRRQELPQVMDNPEALSFLRMTPSVCDMKHLKQLKMKFSPNFSMDFASHVTGAYAFLLMKNTKFVASYNPVMWKQMHKKDYSQDTDKDQDDSDPAADDDNVDVDKLFFGSLKPYVIVIHDIQNY